MTFRRAALEDRLAIDRMLVGSSVNVRLYEILLEAMMRPGDEYIAALAFSEDRVEAVGAYGMVAGTLATGALYGVFPLSSRMTEFLSFAAHDLKTCGAGQIIAEFPDTEEFRPYRDVLLESGYTPAGLVEDFYRDGVAMVIFSRKLI